MFVLINTIFKLNTTGTLHANFLKFSRQNHTVILSNNISFLLPDIYRKHRQEYSCWEPTDDTSNCPVHPSVPLDLVQPPLPANGGVGMHPWVAIWLRAKPLKTVNYFCLLSLNLCIWTGAANWLLCKLQW